MKFTYTEKLPKITLACSTDTTRPLIGHVYFDAELGELQATDTFVAVRIPVAPEKGDASGLLTVETTKGASTGKADAMSAKKKDLAKVEGDYPNLPALWPSAKPVFAIDLDPSVLRRAVEAIGVTKGGVRLTFFGAERPLLVQPLLKSDSAGYGSAYTPREDGDGIAVPEALVMPLQSTTTTATANAAAKTKTTTPATKTPATKKAASDGNGTADADAGDFGKGSEKRLSAAAKAAQTKRERAAAGGSVDAAIRAVATRGNKKAAEPKKTPAKSSSSNGNGKKTPTNDTAEDFGKGSEKRLNAAAKAAQTRRDKAAAAAAK